MDERVVMMAHDDLGARVLRAVDLGMTTSLGLSVALNEDLLDVQNWVDTLVLSGLLSVERDGPDDVLVVTPAGSTTLSDRVPANGLAPGWLDTDLLPPDDPQPVPWGQENSFQLESLPDMRASDTDREDTLAILNQAFAEGRLTADEHGRRADEALCAITHNDLSGLLADLNPTALEQPSGLPRLVLLMTVIALVPLFLLGVLTLNGDASGPLYTLGLLLTVVPPVGIFAALVFFVRDGADAARRRPPHIPAEW